MPAHWSNQKGGAQPAFCSLRKSLVYVVDRGLTAIAVEGTGFEVAAGSVQPMSFPPSAIGAHAGRLGAICCVSVREFTLMKWIRLSPEVDTKNRESSGVKAPATGAVTAELPFSVMYFSCPGVPFELGK